MPWGEGHTVTELVSALPRDNCLPTARSTQIKVGQIVGGTELKEGILLLCTVELLIHNALINHALAGIIDTMIFHALVVRTPMISCMTSTATHCARAAAT